MTVPVPAGPALGEPLNCPFCGKAPTRWVAPGVTNYRCPDLTCPAGAAYRPEWAWNRRFNPLSGRERDLLERALLHVGRDVPELFVDGQRLRSDILAYLSTLPAGWDELREAAQRVVESAQIVYPVADNTYQVCHDAIESLRRALAAFPSVEQQGGSEEGRQAGVPVSGQGSVLDALSRPSGSHTPPLNAASPAVSGEQRPRSEPSEAMGWLALRVSREHGGRCEMRNGKLWHTCACGAEFADENESSVDGDELWQHHAHMETLRAVFALLFPSPALHREGPPTTKDEVMPPEVPARRSSDTLREVQRPAVSAEGRDSVDNAPDREGASQ